MNSRRGETLRQPSAVVFWLYKACVSPLIHAIAPSDCRYLPTCSEYAYTSLVRFGVVRGSWLALRRLLRCHPWAKGGLDPVPERVLAQPDAFMG